MPSRRAPISTSWTWPATVRHVQEVLVPRLDPRDRLAESLRQRRDQQLFDVHAALRAEAAAHRRRAHRDPARIEPERAGDLALHAEDRLRARPHDDPVTLGNDHAAVRLHRRGRDPMVDEPGADDDLGGGPPRAVARRAGGPSSRWRRTPGTATAHPVRAPRTRRSRRRAVASSIVDELGRVERLRARRRDHHRDRLTDEPHALACEQRPIERAVAAHRARGREVEVGAR